MIKRNIKLLAGVAVCSACLSLTGCIEETIPTDGFTQDQVDESDNTITGLMMALPARFNVMDARTLNFTDYAFGYGALMHIRDVQTEDMVIPYSGYDHFRAWEANMQMGENSAYMQYIWNYSYANIMACNKLIAAVNAVEEPTAIELGAKGEGYAFRAMMYLDLARCYEFLPNDIFTTGVNSDGNDVTNLTVPITTETTTIEDTKNNPRATREEMFKFILNDLNQAEELIPNLNGTTYAADKTLASLAVVYGLKARLYMWVGEYALALEFAQDAIDASGQDPISYTDCLAFDDQGYLTGYTKTCFNDISKWMWGVSQTADNSTVTSGIINWTSWMTPEVEFGYSGAGAYPCIHIPMYNRISDSDWRKRLWDGGTAVVPGLSHKFQPNEGNTSVPTVAAATSYPLMRVEEMYFIRFEALAELDPASARNELNSFMRSNRMVFQGPTYNAPSGKDELIDEILFQKRVELWGEGQAFFDIKRRDIAVDRTQDGSNFSDDTRFVTTRRPAWMNYVIVQNEGNNNSALVGWNNPDPTNRYTAVPLD